MSLQHVKQPIPTIRDVAERVGVHKATVAAVLNGGRSTARVSESTRQRIVAAAKELRYSPNALARGLKMVRFKSLGLAFNYQDPSWITADQYGTALLTGIIMSAHTVDYNVTHFHKPWADAEHSAAGFRGQGIDGFLVIAPPLNSDIVAGLSGLGIPVVVISAVPDDPQIPCVVLDNAAAIRLGVEHLLNLGHRKIAYLTSGADHFDINERSASFSRIMAETSGAMPSQHLAALGASSDPGFPVPSEPVFDRNVYQCTHRLLSQPDAPTAVLTSGAGMAEAVLYAARDLGIKVPDELSIVGFDDTRELPHMSPPITTIRQPLIEMGQCAARLLIARLEHEAVSQRFHVYQPEFMLRRSTAPPRKR